MIVCYKKMKKSRGFVANCNAYRHNSGRIVRAGEEGSCGGFCEDFFSSAYSLFVLFWEVQPDPTDGSGGSAAAQ